MRTNTFLIRLVFIAILVGAGYVLRPVPGFGSLSRELASALVALLAAAAVIFFEIRIQKASLKTLIGAAIGSVLGIVGGVLIGFLITSQESGAVGANTKTFLTLALAFLMAYIGLMVGASKGDYLAVRPRRHLQSTRRAPRPQVLDTSVIIDGRIAEVARPASSREPSSSAVHPARTPAGGRLARLLQATARTPRPRHAQPPPVQRQLDIPVVDTDSRPSRRSIETP